MNDCKILKGDVVITNYDIWETTPNGREEVNLGKETYTVVRTEYWEQGGGYLVYGEKSDKRNEAVWHQESDLTIVKRLSQL